jgi:D-alanine--poly(phosphoribitol) ligase subunit 1
MEFSFIHAVDAQGDTAPDVTAFCNSRDESITYGELKRKSDALARWIAAEPAFEPSVPLVVYGHKSPLMLVCFLACVKSGHAYVPVDVLYPRERIANIIGQLGQTAVLDTIGTIPQVMGDLLERPHFDIAKLPDAHYAKYADAPAPAAVGPEDTFYILFTSGSTGTPKGVQIIAECMDNFSNWLLNSEFAIEGKRVWFNRAPYTFELSVTDLAWGLPHGDTLFALEDEAEKSLALTFEALSKSGITDWVSTPSVLDQMLSDEKFGASLIPTLKRTYHVGEVLRP